MAISSVLPRVKDTPSQNELRIQLNTLLRRMNLKENEHFVHTYRRFVNPDRSIKAELYAVDGLHLNFKGTQVLKQYFMGSVVGLSRYVCK